MKTMPNLRLNLIRGLVASALFSGVVASSYAQSTGVIKSSGRSAVANPVAMDTRSFFPQISTTVQQNQIQPKNPSVRRMIQPPALTGWNAPGAGGSTSGNQNALFPGIKYTGYIPADPQIAVSKTHIVQVVNSNIAFFTKTGTKIFERDLGPSGFFSGVGAGTFVFDPKVFYDPGSNRFFVVTLDQDDTSKSSAFLIAVSANGNPSGSWTKYRINNKYTDNSVDAWLDYEGWGFNKDIVVATGNYFTFGGSFAGYVKAFCFSKADMIAAKPLTAVEFIDRTTFTIQVAKTDDKTNPLLFGCSLDSSVPGPAVRIYAWRNILTANPEMVYTSITVPDYDFVGTPPSAGGAFLASLSGRLVDATYRSGSLLTAHTTRALTGNNRSQVTWYEIKPNSWPTSGSPTLGQAGNVSFAGDAWAFLPGINKNSAGDISMVFTRSSQTIIGDVMGVARKSSDAKGKMGTPFVLATGDSAYKMSGRWGDYGSVAVDPSDDLTFWGTNMKSDTNGAWITSIVSYKISNGNGGGGTGSIKPNTVSVLEGSFVAGNLASIQTADTTTYDTNTVKKPDGSYATAIQATFVQSLKKTSVGSITVYSGGFVAPNRTPTGQVFLWNYDLAKWDLIKSATLTDSKSTVIATVSTGGSAYVSADQKLKVMFRGLDPTKRNGYAPAPFKFRTDSVTISVDPK